MMPDMAPWLILQRVGESMSFRIWITDTSQDVIADVAQIAKDVGNHDRKDTTIIHEVLRSDIPPYEKRPERLGQEALGLVIGGTETLATSKLLTALFLHQD